MDLMVPNLLKTRGLHAGRARHIMQSLQFKHTALRLALRVFSGNLV